MLGYENPQGDLDDLKDWYGGYLNEKDKFQ